MADETTFQIAYEGQALEDGSMDVRELAPALLSLSDLIEDTNKVLHGDESEVTLKIDGTEDGSFAVDLALWAGQSAEQLVDIASSPEVDGLANILEILGFGIGFGSSTGLFELIRTYRGRPAESVKPVEGAPDKVEMNFGGEGNTIIVNNGTATMYNSRKAREHARGVLQPLKKPGVTGFRASNNGRQTLHVENTDVPRFEEFEGEEKLLNESENTQLFAIADLSFNPKNMWRLSDGGNVHYVTMSDEDFVRRFQEGQIPVTTKDNLEVRLITRQYRKPDGSLSIDREVVEVIKHIRYSQLDMFDDRQE